MNIKGFFILLLLPAIGAAQTPLPTVLINGETRSNLLAGPPLPSSVFRKKRRPPAGPPLGKNPEENNAPPTLDYGALNRSLAPSLSSPPKKLSPGEKVIVESADIAGKICGLIAGLTVLGVISNGKKK